MSNVAVTWLEGNSRLFTCRDSRGHIVITGTGVVEGAASAEHSNGQEEGAKASDLLLIALASCAAHDVVSILERQRQHLTGLRIDVQGHQQSQPPFAFTAIHLHFILSGEGLEPVKVTRAIDLSVNKYCSVAATVRGVAALTHDFEIESQS